MGYHWPSSWYGTKHEPIGINDYVAFMWFNQGLGYDEFEIEVVRESTQSGFTNQGEESAMITFTGGDYEATMTLSDGTASYRVPVYYNCQIELSVSY